MEEEYVSVNEIVFEETFHPTVFLRWREVRETHVVADVLEQMWLGSKGTERWQPLPRVTGEEPR
jgi:hypothetical protein